MSDDDEEVAGVEDVEPDMSDDKNPLPFPFEDVFGPQIRTVPSSLHEASILWKTGFHETQLTVRVWPVRLASGSSRRTCQI